MALRIDRTGLELEAGPLYLSLSLTLLAFCWADRTGLSIAKESPPHPDHPAPGLRRLVEAWREDSTGCRYVSAFGWLVCLQRRAWRATAVATPQINVVL